MSPLAAVLANAAASALLVTLVGAVFLVVALLGPFGLVLLGLLTLVVCVRVQLGELAPAWATLATPPRLDRRDPPERQASVLAERAEREGQLCFYRRTGLGLLAAGILGTAATRRRPTGQRPTGQPSAGQPPIDQPPIGQRRSG
ncbi:hypothetical protein [Falsiroseomonas sp.]|uniref:hypothetical protein n=1 Tax=Falsiroseomonas sp. TaxID=2870721 RepID=UPI0027338E8E|nr:hypothetical protein [Falsiroseomonas sp.]MDP3417045.1 hypothetical protein [Falsiroseomonas sp.]